MKMTPWKMGLLLLGATFAAAKGAGISFDGSLGHAATLTGPNYTIPASMGTQVGGNLFHSFGQFNLLSGETANFTATGSSGAINNIIARVTGGTPSSINGTIESSIAGANLFLLNPSGVMFGANAKVNVTGAFTIGTADYVKLSDGEGIFHTSLGGNDVLTSAAVSAFGFVSTAPQSVQFSQSKLSFATGSNFTVISGDITLTAATVTAPASNVSLFSAKSSGELPFNPADPSASFGASTVSSFGNVTLKNSSKVAIDSGQGGGSVVIRAGQLVMQNTSSITSNNASANAGGSVGVTSDSISLATGSTITTQALSSGPGGNITLTSAGPISLATGGQFLTSTKSSGPAGNIEAQAQSLSVGGSANAGDDSGIVSQSASGALGMGGNITLTLAGALTIADEGSIAANAFGKGNGGEVSVQASSLSIDGSAAPSASTGIFSESQRGAAGSGGGIMLDVADISIKGAGTIAADTFSSGNAGEVAVQADSLTIDGSAAIGHFTGISSSSNAGARGQGGDVNITANDAISIQGGGAIVADTFSSGKAGAISIQAGSLTIDGTAALGYFTGIASDSDTGSTADGGSITVNVADGISILGGGAIAADTFSPGNAGEIALTSNTLTIDGSKAIGYFTGITSASDTGATGSGGSITVTVSDGISILGTGAIVADTYSSAPAGEISVQAGSMIIDGSADPNGLTGISSNADPDSSNQGGLVTVNIATDLTCTGAGGIDSQAFSTGHGGDVNVTAGDTINLTDGGYIDADTFSAGNGGKVNVSARGIFINGAGPDDLGFFTGINSDSSSYYNSHATGNGGDVVVTATGALMIINGGSIGASTETLGNGGNVIVNAPDDLSLADGSEISSSSSNPGGTTKSAGTAGNVTLNVGSIALNDLSSVATSALAADAGSITITAATEITLASGSSVTTSAGDSGGSIILKAGRLLYLLDSSITATAGSLKKAGVTGSGGDITIDPQFVVLDDSLISANAAIGKGGNISITTDNYLNNDSLLTATGSTNGTITISAPDLDLSGSLVGLPAELVNEQNRLRERCAQAMNHEFSSLIVVGRGGTESAPEELQPDFGIPYSR